MGCGNSKTKDQQKAAPKYQQQQQKAAVSPKKAQASPAASQPAPTAAVPDDQPKAAEEPQAAAPPVEASHEPAEDQQQVEDQQAKPQVPAVSWQQADAEHAPPQVFIPVVASPLFEDETSEDAAVTEEDPEVVVVKRRPLQSASTSGVAASVPRSVGQPRGNYEDYAPVAASETADGAVDAEGRLTVRPDGAAEGFDPKTGQLIEREEPVWHVARQPPPTRGWVLLRQVRMVLQMRKVSII